MKKYIFHILSLLAISSVAGCSGKGLLGMSFGIVFLIWILPSVIPAMIASNKGRSALGLFLLSIFFTPIVGLIVALIIAPISKPDAPEHKEHTSNDTTQARPSTNSTTFKQDITTNKDMLYWRVGVVVFFLIVLLVVVLNSQ